MNLDSALLQPLGGVGDYPFLERLSIAPYLHGNETLNLGNPDWEDTEFRVCILQPGHLEPKLMSHTLTQLVALMRKAEEKTGVRMYIDFAFRPGQRDCAELRKKGVPEVFGWTSLHELSDFDVLCCSFSVHFESASILPVLWGGGIEPFHRKRDQKTPFIMGGGIMAQYLEALFGYKDGAVLDLLFLGEGEGRLTELLEVLVKERSRLRWDRLGVIHDVVTKFENLYYPDGYEHVYEGIKLVEIRKRFDWCPDKVKYYRNYNLRPTIFENRLLLTDNDHAGRAALRISQGCSGAGCCSFCTEGSEAGPWREYPIDHVVGKFNDLVGSCAPNLLSYYAYNLNFHSGYVKLMEEASKRFANQSVIAFRADVVAETPGYIRLLKQMGASRITIALEGISERMRVMLNKNVTWNHFDKVAEQVFAEDIGVLKVNLIVTGYETQEDYDEFISKVEAFIRKRDEVGSRVKLSFSATILVTYWNTAMQWSPRRSIVEAMNTDKVYQLFERCRALGVAVKLHSGHEYTFQQLMIDAGRSITEPVVDWYRAVWEQNKALFYPFEDLNNRIFEYLGVTDREAYFLQEHGYGELNPTSTYDIIPYQTQSMWFQRQSLPYCLRTQANKNPKCHGCGLCNVDLRNTILTRAVETDMNVPLGRNLARSTLRVYYQIAGNDYARCRHKLVLCHSIAGKLIKMLGLEEQFHSVCNYSDEAITANGQNDVWDGFGAFDIDFRCGLRELQNKVPRTLYSEFNDGRVISTQTLDKNALEVKYGSVWRFYAKQSPDVLSERMDKWDGTVVIRTQTDAVTVQNGTLYADRKDMGLCLGGGGSGSVGFMYLGHRLNPLMVLASMFKIPLLKVKSEFRVSRMGLYRDRIGICKMCGGVSERDVISHSTAVCGKCACKLYYRR